MRHRSNEEWREALAGIGPERDEALADLRACVLRAARYYLCGRAPGRSGLDPERAEALAEDAAQEATLSVLGKLDAFRGESAFPTWASKFGVSAAAGLLRRREWSNVSLEDLPDWGEGVVAAAREVCEDPEAGARRREAWCAFREVVECELTKQQRMVLSLVFFHGMPPDEVAERLGISRGACYKAGHDMRRAVKQARVDVRRDARGVRGACGAGGRMTTADRLRWWLGTLETTEDEEIDCDVVFEVLDTVAEAAARGEDVGGLFPAIALHLHHCPSCRDLFDTLVELTADAPSSA